MTVFLLVNWGKQEPWTLLQKAIYSQAKRIGHEQWTNKFSILYDKHKIPEN
jgi:hypothetical protein